MAPLVDIRAHFHQLFLCFQNVTQSLILAYLKCYCCWHSEFLILHSAKILCHHNTLAWVYISASHYWRSSLFSRSGFQNLQPSSSFQFPLLKWLQEFLQQHQNLLLYVVHASIFCTCINQISKNLLEVARLSLISWRKYWRWRPRQPAGEILMLSVAKYQEFKIPSGSVISVASDSSTSDLPYVGIREKRIELLNGSDALKSYPYGWYKEVSFSK